MASPRAKLSEIVEALDLMDDTSAAYLDRQTGAVVVVSEEDTEAAEDEESAADAPDWQREQIELARQVEAESSRFLPLPDRFEIHEWQMMADFAAAAEETAGERLNRVVRGPRAFRRFKDEVRRLGIADRWYAYREDCYRRVAADWCEENGIEWEPDEGGGR